MDALEGISSDEAGSASSSESEAEPLATKKAKTELTIDDLQAAGYQGGPSVLYMKAPQEQRENTWEWCAPLR